MYHTTSPHNQSRGCQGLALHPLDGQFQSGKHIIVVCLHIPVAPQAILRGILTPIPELHVNRCLTFSAVNSLCNSVGKALNHVSSM